MAPSKWATMLRKKKKKRKSTAFVKLRTNVHDTRLKKDFEKKTVQRLATHGLLFRLQLKK